MATQLSEHFTLEELCHSDVALRAGIDNSTTDPSIVASLTDLAIHILEPIRRQFNIPFSPTSGYRCLALNTLIKGAANSQHMVGKAADIVLPTVTRPQLAEWIRVNLDFDQLILEYYSPGQPDSGWVHCSYNTGNNRKQVLTYQPGSAGPVDGLQP
jgi:zinc D-Ala-D-Ala carboxypeptidase